MVVDTIENISLYKSLGEKISRALDYLKSTDFETMPSGRYAVEGEDIFAIVNEYETKDKKDCEAEAHRKYIDVQFIVKGEELFGYTPLANQLPVKDYDEENDYAVYNNEVSYIKLEPGMFIIFYPTDIHQPEVKVYEPMMVKKVVMKVKV
jgi:YhcH/YjgK/YiaL family protein